MATQVLCMGENNPHDSLIRHMFSHREVAAAALRTLLPADLTTGLRLEDAQLLEGTFVD